MKNSVIGIDDDDDDDDFLFQVDAAEADALASKRRRITPSVKPAVVSSPFKQVKTLSAGDGGGGSGGVDGLYMAALKGDHSVVRKSTVSDSLRGRVAKGRVKVVDTGNDDVSGGGDSCFKCGKSGHWARDCDAGGGGYYGNSRSDQSISEKSCPCGLGICTVLTANTEKNRGRKFYKCPLRQENGGCGFFEWCDNVSGTNSIAGGNYTSDSSYPGLPCPCGAGLCLILTAKTGNNIGQQFYRCPSNQGNSCGFFKWCNEQTASVGRPVTASKVSYTYNSSDTDTNNRSYDSRQTDPRNTSYSALHTDTRHTSHNARTGSSCFKCGKEGHWARDCSMASSNPPAELVGRSASSGTCYKCGKPGHWSRDCSFS